jgi:urease subunit gamma
MSISGETLQSLREVGSSKVPFLAAKWDIFFCNLWWLQPNCADLWHRCGTVIREWWTAAVGKACNVRNPTDVRNSVPFTGRSCKSKIKWNRRIEVETGMQLTPREFDKLMIYMVAEVALKRKAKGLKLNYPEAVAIISAAALDGARAGKAIEDVAKEAREVLTKDDVMDGVADLIPMVQVEAVFTDGSRLVTVHTPIQ